MAKRKRKKRRAWMPMWWGDYLADTTHLNTTEHGAYLLLIAHYWMRGSLPTDERQIQRITGMTNPQWAKSKHTIKQLFTAQWTHERVVSELQNMKRLSDAGKVAAEASVKARSEKGKKTTKSKGDGQRSLNDRPTIEPTEEQRPPNETPTPITITKTTEEDGGGGTGDALESEKKKAASRGSVISEEAFQFTDAIFKIVGIDPEFVPPSWMGTASRVQMWINHGWDQQVVLDAITRMIAEKRDGIPSSAKYFEKGIAREIASRLDPLPTVVPLEPRKVTAHAQATGHNPKSIVGALDRLSDRLREARSGMGDGTGKNDLQRLPKR